MPQAVAVQVKELPLVQDHETYCAIGASSSQS